MQLQVQAEATPECFAGHGKHMTSGQAAHFHSLDAFLAFIARVLAQGPPPQE